MNRSKTWLLIFDAAQMRIYDYDKREKNYIPLIKEIQRPENKLRDFDITSDKPGRFRAKGTGISAYEQESDPKRVNFERFAQEINKVLVKCLNSNNYEKLIIVAAPRMLGLLLQNIDKQVKKTIIHQIEKNVVQFPDKKLMGYVKEAIWR